MRTAVGHGRGLATLTLAGLALATGVTVHAAPPTRRGPVVAVSGGSFPHRHEQYVSLVANGSEQALAHLIAAYRRRDFEATEKGRIVSLVCDGFSDASILPALAAWRAKDDSDGDAWLWYRTLRREIGEASPRRAYDTAGDATLSIPLRAASLRALAAWADEGIPAFVAGEVKRLASAPTKLEPPKLEPAESSLWIATLAEALASQPGRVGAPEVRTAVESLLPFLRERAVLPRARLQLARALVRLLNAPTMTFEPSSYEAWMDRLERPPRAEDDRYAAPRFFGVEGTGDRIVYVLDLSGSMNDSLTKEEKSDLRALVDAGKGAAGGALESIAFDKIDSRLDAAVEFTKASIRALKESSWFAVLYFSSSYAWADGATELRPATKANVAAALKSVDRTRMGYGTNLHGGLRRAFETLVPLPGHKSRLEFSTGTAEDAARAPTTIFILSDGAPTWDDWGFGGREPTGPSAQPAASSGDTSPTAPYEETTSLVDDIARLNLLRDCEIHAIGIGEYEPQLFDRLAHVGRGKVRRIGPALGAVDAAGKDRSRTFRDLVDLYRRLKMPVPSSLLKEAAEEEKREREAKAAAGGAPTAPAPAPAPVPAPPPAAPAEPGAPRDLKEVETGATPEIRAAAADRLARGNQKTAIPVLARVLASDADATVQRACDSALRRLAGVGFGDGLTGLLPFERTAIRRNWDWWWALHRAQIEKSMEASKPADPNPPKEPAPPVAPRDDPTMK